MDMLQLAFKKYNYIKLKLAILSNKSFTTIMIATLVQDVLKKIMDLLFTMKHINTNVYHCLTPSAL